MTLSVTAFGPIKHIAIPAGWKGPQTLSHPDMRQWQWFTNETNPGVTLNVFYRGVPVSREGIDPVLHLIASRPKTGTADLTTAEIAPLREFLGTRSVGSNQYTDPGQPVFDLDTVKIGSIGSHPALFVRGRFNYAKPDQEKNEFDGVFLPCGEDRRDVYEVFFQAAGSAAFERFSPQFEMILKSIILRKI